MRAAPTASTRNSTASSPPSPRKKDPKKIIKVIEKFKSGVNDHRVEADYIVRTTLLRDADTLIIRWGGTPRT